MTPEGFEFRQASLLAGAFGEAGVDYLLIGKSGAILHGFPGTTQDVDVLLAPDEANILAALRALSALGFSLHAFSELRPLNEFKVLQITDGPFDVDLLTEADGISSFAEAMERSVAIENCRVASLDDIIRSKEAANRARDQRDLPLLYAFRKSLGQTP